VTSGVLAASLELASSQLRAVMENRNMFTGVISFIRVHVTNDIHSSSAHDGQSLLSRPRLNKWSKSLPLRDEKILLDPVGTLDVGATPIPIRTECALKRL
jgi:hypothetical protein